MNRAVLACLLLMCAPAVVAQQFEDTVDDYVVVGGDTIAGITKRLLGDEAFWEDNWKLNPQVRDPNKLRIGQRLRIITERKVIAESARLVEAVNQTEKMLERPRWQPAARGDELAAGQGLRTRERSAAELRFNAESSLRLAEFSQVFLARKDTTLRGIDRGSVTVEQGDVDLLFAPLARPRTQIEIVAGPSTTTPLAEPGSRAEIRSGATDDGGARVMVFAGRSEVAAAGSTVDVKRGEGTRVPEAGPPAPPEKLLPAPRLIESTVTWNYSNGLIAWQEVASAAGYVVAVCADPDCREPRQRHAVAGDRRQLQVEPLPAGSSHWRVHAVSASGLDGYPSAVGAIEVTDPTPDLEGPMLALQSLSGFVDGADGATRLGPAARLRVHAHDERSGVARIEIRHGDGDWQAWTKTILDLADLREGPSISMRAIDRLRQPSPVLVVQIVDEPIRAMVR